MPSLLSRIEAAANAFSGVDIQAACSPSWKHKGSEIASAIGAKVQKTVDSLMAPLDGRETAENFESPLSKQRVSALSEDAPQILAQQLLEDLEKAAAKVDLISYASSSIAIFCLYCRCFVPIWCICYVHLQLTLSQFERLVVSFVLTQVHLNFISFEVEGGIAGFLILLSLQGCNWLYLKGVGLTFY